MGVAREEVQRWRCSGAAASSPARARAVANAMTAPRILRQMGDFDCGPAAAERHSPGRASRSGGRGAGDRAGHARSIGDARARPPRWSRPTGSSRRGLSALLARWGVEADDSAGHPLSKTRARHLAAGNCICRRRGARAGAAARRAQASAGRRRRARSGSAGWKAFERSTSRCADRARRRGSPGSTPISPRRRAKPGTECANGSRASKACSRNPVSLSSLAARSRAGGARTGRRCVPGAVRPGDRRPSCSPNCRASEAAGN